VRSLLRVSAIFLRKRFVFIAVFKTVLHIQSLFHSLLLVGVRWILNQYFIINPHKFIYML